LIKFKRVSTTQIGKGREAGGDSRGAKIPKNLNLRRVKKKN